MGIGAGGGLMSTGSGLGAASLRGFPFCLGAKRGAAGPGVAAAGRGSPER